jgi:mRNA interferase RelE/StbE
MMVMKQITYTRSALKVLRRMPANTAKLIVAKVEQYAVDPVALANKVTALKGREGIRLRVGDWRVIMEDGVVLAVLEIGPRGSIYD